MKFDFQKAFERQEAIKVRLNELANAIETEKRDLKEAEQAEKRELMREQQVLDMKIAAARHNENMSRDVKMDKNAVLREALMKARATDSTGVKNITLGTEVKNSGAIALNIHDMIDNLEEGTGLPTGINIVYGVKGDELYPVSINDVEMQEVGEVDALTAQDIDFDKINVTSNRCGLTVNVSNSAIDDADFDLLGFVKKKFAKALRKYLAKKLLSSANWTKNKGPFAGMTAGSNVIDITNGTAYANILEAVAKFTDKGIEPESICFVISATAEAKLKATPKDSKGKNSGWVIENGKLAGYDYVVSHHINYDLTSGSYAKGSDELVGIGFWNYEAVQQHGEVRMTIDATSNAVAVKDVTAITLNTKWSMTDISQKLYDEDGKVVRAFALYKLA